MTHAGLKKVNSLLEAKKQERQETWKVVKLILVNAPRCRSFWPPSAVCFLPDKDLEHPAQGYRAPVPATVSHLSKSDVKMDTMKLKAGG